MAITWLFGVETNITPLLTIGAASWTRVSPVENTQTGFSRADIRRRDLVERAVAPAVIGAADHQPVAVFRFHEAVGRHRLVAAQDLRHRHIHLRRSRLGERQRDSCGDEGGTPAAEIGHQRISLVRHHTPGERRRSAPVLDQSKGLSAVIPAQSCAAQCLLRLPLHRRRRPPALRSAGDLVAGGGRPWRT